MSQGGSLEDEVARLRELNAQLQLQLQRQQVSTSSPSAAVLDANTNKNLAAPAADSPLEASLRNRTVGQKFKIRTWDKERGARSPEEAPPQPESLPASQEQEVAEDVLTMPSMAPWIAQPKLLGGSMLPCPADVISVYDQFRNMGEELATMTAQAVAARAQDMFITHTADSNSPYLAFSAGVPGLFAAMCSAQACVGTSSLQRLESAADPDAFIRCTEVLKLLRDASPLAGSSFRRRPASMARSSYVRELCSYAGVCMDIARLGFVHMKCIRALQRQTPGSDQGNALVTQAANAPCVPREELRDCLSLAGKALVAMQMDMDRLHDEAVVLAAKGTKDSSSNVDGNARILTRSLSTSSTASAANATAADVVEPSLPPTFGEFFDQQFLPLYICDTPFDTLRHLGETYCGIPLTSDDEDKAWKILGLPTPKRSTKAAARSPCTPPPTPTARVPSTPPAPSITALCAGKPGKSNTGPVPMRQQMNTSIVEKRRSDFLGFRDMETSLFKRPRVLKSDMPAPSPIIKPSAALTQIPQDVLSAKEISSLSAMTGSLAMESSIRKMPQTHMGLDSSIRVAAGSLAPAPTPLSMRKDSKAFLQSIPPLRPARKIDLSPQHGSSEPTSMSDQRLHKSQSTPCWDALD